MSERESRSSTELTRSGISPSNSTAETCRKYYAAQAALVSHQQKAWHWAFRMVAILVNKLVFDLSRIMVVQDELNPIWHL
jgi:hypothetical protein